jgi:hypothetical protein
MRRTVKCLLAFGSLLFVQGCSVFDVVGVVYYIGTADQRRVSVALSQFSDSVVLGDFEKAVNFFEENGELIVEGNETIVGKANILGRLKSEKADKVLAYDFKQTSIAVQHDGFMQSGTYRRISVNAEGAANSVEGTFNAEWVSRPAGGWQMHMLRTAPAAAKN